MVRMPEILMTRFTVPRRRLAQVGNSRTAQSVINGDLGPEISDAGKRFSLFRNVHICSVHVTVVCNHLGKGPATMTGPECKCICANVLYY